MKKRELVKRISKVAKAHNVSAAIVRQGKHEIWECEGFTFPVPRHAEIAERTAQTILDKLEAHLTKKEEDQ